MPAIPPISCGNLRRHMAVVLVNTGSCHNRMALWSNRPMNSRFSHWKGEWTCYRFSINAKKKCLSEEKSYMCFQVVRFLISLSEHAGTTWVISADYTILWAFLSSTLYLSYGGRSCAYRRKGTKSSVELRVCPKIKCLCLNAESVEKWPKKRSLPGKSDTLFWGRPKAQ